MGFVFLQHLPVQIEKMRAGREKDRQQRLKQAGLARAGRVVSSFDEDL